MESASNVVQGLILAMRSSRYLPQHHAAGCHGTKVRAKLFVRSLACARLSKVTSMRHLRLIIFFATTLAMATSIANAKILINVDKSAQMMTVSVDGEPRWTWPVSTGR